MSDNYGLQCITTFYSPWGNGRDWVYIGDVSYRHGKSHWQMSAPLRKTPPYGKKPSSKNGNVRRNLIPRAQHRPGPSGESYLVLETLPPRSGTAPPGLRHRPTSTLPRAHHEQGPNGSNYCVMEPMPLPPRAKSAPSGDLKQVCSDRHPSIGPIAEKKLQAKRRQRQLAVSASAPSVVDRTGLAPSPSNFRDRCQGTRKKIDPAPESTVSVCSLAASDIASLLARESSQLSVSPPSKVA